MENVRFTPESGHGYRSANVRFVPEAEVTEETFLSPLGVKIGRSEAVH